MGEGTTQYLASFNIEDLELFRKKKTKIHFIRSIDIGTEGETIDIPTLEGNVKVQISNNIYIMIGLYQDTYPVKEELFLNRYSIIEDEWDSSLERYLGLYGITKDKIHSCILKKDVFVYAKKMDCPFKVYSSNAKSYLYGEEGDYYTAAAEDIGNAYIIQGDIMSSTYEKAEHN